MCLENTQHFVHGAQDKWECKETIESATIQLTRTSLVHHEEAEVDLTWSCDLEWFSFQNHCPGIGGGSKSERKTQNRMDGQCQIMDWKASFLTVVYDTRLKEVDLSCVTHFTADLDTGQMMITLGEICYIT